MNLTTEPWIPVTDAQGQARNVSLHEVFAAGDSLRDLAVRPHERVALMRLLICIAQAALDGPTDSDALESSASKLPGAAQRYLDEWQESFDLFHPTMPFLQFPGLTKTPKPAKKKTSAPKSGDRASDREDAKPNPVTKLDFGLSAGNKTTLFDHGAASDEWRVMKAEQIAISLVAFQCFAPSEIVGAAKWRKIQIAKGTASMAPCTPKAMIHAFVRRRNVFETLVANLLTREGVKKNYQREWGKPVWEVMPTRLEPVSSPDSPTHTYLGRLVPLSRAILLNRDKKTMTLANGLRYPTFPDFSAEPSASVIVSKKAQSLVSAGQKQIWRQLPALVVKRLANESGGPLTLSELTPENDIDLWVGALLATTDEGILDTVEGVYPIPARMLNEPGRRAYEDEVKESEHVAWKLGDACKTYRQHLELKPQGYPEKEHAFRRYWTGIEQNLPLLHASLRAADGSEEQSDALARWRAALWSSARDAFDSACASETPRQRRGHALALRSLFKSKRQKPAETPALAPA